MSVCTSEEVFDSTTNFSSSLQPLAIKPTLPEAINNLGILMAALRSHLVPWHHNEGRDYRVIAHYGRSEWVD